jgi:hypothetical protein
MTDVPSAIEPPAKSGTKDVQYQIGFVTACKYGGRSGTDPFVKRRMAKRLAAQKERRAEGGTKDIKHLLPELHIWDESETTNPHFSAGLEDTNSHRQGTL